MFYAHIILAKKGPLARVWLAAHWDKKITKAHVFETNIEKSVEGIMQPKVKLALRTSGHLLLGVVRIYSRKAKYLLADCNEAFVKIKMAFRPGMVDLPEGHREANVNAITLPEVFHDFDTALPELNDIDIEAQFSINQTRADEITLREDYGSMPISLHDDGFGDVGFDGDTPDMVREQFKDNLTDNFFDGVDLAGGDHLNNTLRDIDTDITSARVDGDGFGDEFGQPELFGDELFGDPPPHVEAEINATSKEIPEINEDSNNETTDHFDAGVRSPSVNCEGSPMMSQIEEEEEEEEVQRVNDQEEEPNNDPENPPDPNESPDQNENESFALAPIDAAAIKGLTKTKRKRKLIVDEIKNISGEEMKAQLANTLDIVTTLDLAPPTKRLMYWKETGGVEKLFSLPSRMIPAKSLFTNYQRHTVSHLTPLEDFISLAPSDVLALDQFNNENGGDASIVVALGNKRTGGRKRKLLDQQIGLINNNNNSNNQGQNVSGDMSSTVNNNINMSMEEIREQRSLGQTTGDLIGTQGVGVGGGLVVMDGGMEETVGGGVMDGGGISHPQSYEFNDVGGVSDNLGSIADIAYTPLNLNHGISDISDECNVAGGGMTPHHRHGENSSPQPHDIESIQSIPNLPADQVSSILNEAENMPHCSSQNPALLNLNKTLVPDWSDIHFPASIELDNHYDEQLENETNEQFEERVLNKRAAQLFHSVKSHLSKQDGLLLSNLTANNSRKQAAQKFYSLLVLKKYSVLNIEQAAPYMDIVITRGQQFENPKL